MTKYTLILFLPRVPYKHKLYSSALSQNKSAARKKGEFFFVSVGTSGLQMA